ncbi:MAG: hypothetical protein GF349_04310 [Candidatus Magasanikbacteria bacterium]|nr:hypothetical protein [Candidatus Magasanikbacteria bacterium]
MGIRKKVNQRVKIARQKAKVRRDENKLKRQNKEKTPGQKLHDIMHGRGEK